MSDQDYAELRIRLMAHQVLLCAVLATHQNKDQILAALAQGIDQIQSQLLASHLEDHVLDIFDKEIQAILKKSGLVPEGNQIP